MPTRAPAPTSARGATPVLASSLVDVREQDYDYEEEPRDVGRRPLPDEPHVRPDSIPEGRPEEAPTPPRESPPSRC
eukprot:5267857-Alexandrium_andersonii.AAC.1